jgi:hypothetical protein
MKKWIEFKVIAEKPKTKIYKVLSLYDNTELGAIYWYGKWRQYVFEPNAETVWSDECLKELYDFLYKLKEDRKVIKE